MDDTLHQSALGKASAWPERHDPDLLLAIPRCGGRQALPASPDFVGCDIWHAWELSWLNSRGKPCSAVGRFIFDCHGRHLIESKSFKLYLNGLAHTRFDSRQQLAARLHADLEAASQGGIEVTLLDPTREPTLAPVPLAGTCLDTLDIAIDRYGPPQAELLTTAPGAAVEETLVTRLFRSNCPVTGQPDWASVQVGYRGQRIDHEGLLRYLISFRHHSGFHEQCVEAIFTDIRLRCTPDSLAVYACFTRRGGLDISPWRSSERPRPAAVTRDVRQ